MRKKIVLILFSLACTGILLNKFFLTALTEADLEKTLKVVAKDNDPVAVLLTLKLIIDEAVKKGEKAPNFNLCQISIPNTNLFCKVNKGIRRIKMPQLVGVPRPGSKADLLPHNEQGQVDAIEQFKEFLQDHGYILTFKRIPAEDLKATQNEIIGTKAAALWWVLKKNPQDPGIRAPIFISEDNYILDGHHRWAAVVGIDFEDGQLGNVYMNTIQVNAPIEELVGLANTFVDEFGIVPEAGDNDILLTSTD